MVVTRLLLIAVSMLAFAVQASARFSLSCESAHQGWPVLELEAGVSTDGKHLSSFRAYLEIETGTAIEFGHDDVKSFSARNDIALSFTKGPPREEVQVRVNLKRVDDIELVGMFVVRAGKNTHDGRIRCSAG
jgi:hypothetical protein